MPFRVEHISKTFPGTKALSDVNLSLEPGKIHALLGANGSGKSTLAKVLTGVYRPDSGTIEIGDQRMPGLSSPHEADKLGIRVVYQEAPLVDTMTVVECFALFRGYPTQGFGRIRWSSLLRQVREVFTRLDIPVDPEARASQLGPAERAMVALAIALAGIDQGGVNLLILDEATASLQEGEADTFLQRVRSIAESGVAVLMVTHRLQEVLNYADRVTVLANGRVVHDGEVKGLTEEFLISKMIGEPVRALDHEVHRAASDGQVEALWEASGHLEGSDGKADHLLVVEHLAGAFLRDVTFALDRGEIVGVTGLPDSGIGELPLILSGASPRARGTIFVNGEAMPPGLSPRRAIQAGVALVPADRLRQGGVMNLPVRGNLTLPDVPRYWHQSDHEDRVVRTAIEVLDVRPPDDRAVFSGLSGGNQQKVILAKWLLLHPSILILDDPTSGVDPGARRKLFEVLRDAAVHGVGILFFSTEPEQLALMCNRVLVLRHGAIGAELKGEGLTTDAIVQRSYA